MSKYRKKPVVIEACRFQLDSFLPDWFMDRVTNNTIITHEDGTCDIKTLEGIMKANKGDFIILGVNGEAYPCKPDIFEKTYELVLDSEAHEGVKLCFEETGEEVIIKPYKPDDFLNSQIKS